MPSDDMSEADLARAVRLFLRNDLNRERYQGQQSAVLEHIARGYYSIGGYRDTSNKMGFATFKHDVLEELGLTAHPLAEAVWQLAWAGARAGDDLDTVYRIASVASWLIPWLVPSVLNDGKAVDMRPGE